MNNFFAIAKILRPHGVKGDVKVRTLSDFSLDKFSKVYIGKTRIESKLLNVKNLNKFFALSLNGVDSIEKAEMFRDQLIEVDKNDYKSLFHDDVFTNEIIGFEVLDKQGNLIGIVSKIDEYGASTILTISHSGMSYQLPMIDELIWLSQDKKYLVVDKKRFDEVKI